MPDKVIPGTSVVESPTPDASLPNNLAVTEPDRYSYDDDPFGDTVPEVKETKNDTHPANEKPTEEVTPLAGVEPSVEPNKPASFVPPVVPEVIPTPGVVAPEVETLKAQLATRDAEIAQSKQEIETLKSVQITLEEIKKDPITFIRKHVPHLADKLDPNRYINEKLREEFGPEFTYDGGDAYREGTDSYRYRLREAEIRDGILREQHKIEAQRALDSERHKQALLDSKTKVMKDYGLNEDQFSKEVQQWSLTKAITFEDIAKLRFFDQIVKKACDKAVEAARKGAPPPSPPGPTRVTGDDAGTKDIPDHLKEFHDEFGD